MDLYTALALAVGVLAFLVGIIRVIQRFRYIALEGPDETGEVPRRERSRGAAL